MKEAQELLRAHDVSITPKLTVHNTTAVAQYYGFQLSSSRQAVVYDAAIVINWRALQHQLCAGQLLPSGSHCVI
jgi:hypothetical protein